MTITADVTAVLEALATAPGHRMFAFIMRGHTGLDQHVQTRILNRLVTAGCVTSTRTRTRCVAGWWR